MDQLGVSGSKGLAGIPAATVTWNPTATQYTAASGAWTSGTSYSATIFTEISKTPDADLKPYHDLNGEKQGDWRRNIRTHVKFSARTRGATGTGYTAGNPLPAPLKGLPILITSTVDTELACAAGSMTDTCLLDSCSVSYTPDEEAILEIEATIWRGKLFNWPL